MGASKGRRESCSRRQPRTATHGTIGRLLVAKHSRELSGEDGESLSQGVVELG